MGCQKIEKETPDHNNTTASNTVQENKIEPAVEFVIKITARKLYAEYEENEIKADEKYKDTWLEVSGEIKDFGKDIFDNPYIIIKSGDEHSLGGVQCNIFDSEKPKVSKLSKGQLVIIKGKNSGMEMMSVVLNDCIIK